MPSPEACSDETDRELRFELDRLRRATLEFISADIDAAGGSPEGWRRRHAAWTNLRLAVGYRLPSDQGDKSMNHQDAAERIANFARWLSRHTAINADNEMLAAADILSEDGHTKAATILDGMRTGIQQAREAAHGSRVCVIWFDGWGSRVTFSWDGDAEPNPDMHQAIASALNSALRKNESEPTKESD